MSLTINHSFSLELRTTFQPGYGHRKLQNWPVKKQVLMPQSEILLASWKRTKQRWGLWILAALTRRPDGRASRAWQRIRWTVSRSVDVSTLIFLKMELILVPKYTRVFQTLLLLPPTVTLLTQGGKITPRQLIFFKGCRRQAYVCFSQLSYFWYWSWQKEIESNSGWETLGSCAKPNSVWTSTSDPPTLWKCLLTLQKTP